MLENREAVLETVHLLLFLWHLPIREVKTEFEGVGSDISFDLEIQLEDQAANGEVRHVGEAEVAVTGGDAFQKTFTGTLGMEHVTGEGERNRVLHRWRS